MVEIKNKFEQDKKLIYTCFTYTFLWGLLTYGYVFLSNAFSHDSMKEYIGNPSILGHKIQLGRIFVPYYQKFFRGIITLPWVIGAISLVSLSLTIYLIAKIIKTDNRMFIFTTAGIFVANISVIALSATYMHDMDCYMIAILMAVTAVYLWDSNKFGFIAGVPFLTVMLGFYQSYLSVPIMLIILVCIRGITGGQSCKDVFIKGLKGIAMILVAGGLYLVAIRVVTAVTGAQLKTSGYNSMGAMFEMTLPQIISSVKNTYFFTIENIAKPVSVYGGVNVLMHGFVIMVIFITLAMRLCSKNIGAAEKILMLILVFVSPAGINVARILANGYSHELMHYAIRLVYFYAVVLVYDLYNDMKGKKINFAAYMKNCLLVVVFIILWGNVRLANTAYIYKDYLYDANLSFFTRVLSKIDGVDGYVPGWTGIAFIGSPTEFFDYAEEYGELLDMVGMDSLHILGNRTSERYRYYFKYMLMTDIVVVDREATDEIKNMPSFPADGSVRMIDDVVIVKFSDV